MHRLAALAVVFGALVFVRDSRADAATDMAQKIIVVMERAATIAVANTSDCDAMGDKLNKLFDDNEALLQAAREQNKKLTEAQRAALVQRFRPRLAAAMQKLMRPIATCQSNPKVAAVINRAQSF